MHAQERALIDAIRAEPGDDALRLVYADWLEENGCGERAEFIRLQVPPPVWPKDCEREERASELLVRHRADWLAPLGHGAAVQFTRGMPELRLNTLAGVGVWGDKVKREGWPPQLVGCRVQLFEEPFPRDADVRDLASSALFPHITILELDGHRLDQPVKVIKALVTSPGARGLFDLTLRQVALGRDGGVVIGGATHLAQLRRLSLLRSPLWPNGFAPIARSQVFGSLTHLYLYESVDKEDATIALSQAKRLANLTSLSLPGARIGDARLRVLVSGLWAGQLTELDLTDNALGDPGAIALAQCPALARLVGLNLASNQIGDAGAVALHESPYLQGLKDLALGGNRLLSEQVRQRLRQRFASQGRPGL